MRAKTDFQKTFEKAKTLGFDYCRICGRDLWGSETDTFYAITTRKTVALFHRDCVIREAQKVQKRCTLKFTEVVYR